MKKKILPKKLTSTILVVLSPSQRLNVTPHYNELCVIFNKWIV